MQNTTPETLSYFETVVAEASKRLAPSIRVFHPVDLVARGEFLLLVAYRSGSTHSYFTGISDVYRNNGPCRVQQYACVCRHLKAAVLLHHHTCRVSLARSIHCIPPSPPLLPFHQRCTP